jgi:methionine biosynthesis protein MetW
MSVAEYYDTYWSDSGAGFRGRECTAVEAMLGPYVGAESDCLDVGCGDGRTVSRWLTATTRSCIGVDVSARAVQAAQALGVDARVIDDASQLPFADCSFDLVTSVEVFEHLFEPERAAAEILRVTRPGGHVFVQVPNVAHWRHRLEFALRGRFVPLGDQLSLEQPWRDPHIRFFTPATLSRMLAKVGFEAVAITGSTGSLLRDLPLLHRAFADAAAAPASERLARQLPAVFAQRVQCVARRPRSVAPG